MSILYIKSLCNHSFTATVEALRKFCLVTPLYIKKNLLISLNVSTNAGKPLGDWLNPVENDSLHFSANSANAATFAFGGRP